MATIEDLQPSLLSLPAEEQVALMLKIRLNRRTTKFVGKKARTKKSQTAAIEKAFKKLTIEQKQKLVRELMGG